MDEQARFEARAVLTPRRGRWNRLAVAVPALALVAIAWAGVTGTRSASDVAQATDAVVVAAPSIAVPSPAIALHQLAGYPTRVVGLPVERLDEVQAQSFGRDTPVAVAGWYVATEITGCPPLAALYREGSLPEVRGDADSWAFCQRSGTLYGSRPDVEQHVPIHNPAGSHSESAELSAVWVTMVIGVVVPRELEAIGTAATPVVLVGRFVESDAACSAPAGCGRQLVVDHVAWAAGVDDPTGQLIGGDSGAAPGRPRLPADGLNVLTGG